MLEYPDSRITYNNVTFEEIFGWDFQENKFLPRVEIFCSLPWHLGEFPEGRLFQVFFGVCILIKVADISLIYIKTQSRSLKFQQLIKIETIIKLCFQ